MYVPVKIFDYMSVGVEIIAIADNDSATADIVNKLGCALAGHKANEIVDMFLRCVEGNIGSHIDQENHFHCRKGIENLDNCLSYLL
jgi:hypothetical protein